MPTQAQAVLPMRDRARLVNTLLAEKLQTVLPVAMREAGIDMWLILCNEDNLDPVFTTLVPMDTWCPILQMLVFYDTGTAIEKINISGTDTHDLYDRPIITQLPEKQWPLLASIIEERKPNRIGVNTGPTQWAAAGLTVDLCHRLKNALGEPYRSRLVSAEDIAVRWLATLTDNEIDAFETVISLAQNILKTCLSAESIEPGITTTNDLVWKYWQYAADLGIEVSFKPHFGIVRSPAALSEHPSDDGVIRPGDLIHSDVGIKYLRLNSDHQQMAYVTKDGETTAPEDIRSLFSSAGKLQEIFMVEFRRGLTGNELLGNILSSALDDELPNPKVYSHSLGYFLHEPGPLIGLPWEQVRCEGRGDVRLEYNYAFTMELSVADEINSWGSARVAVSLEEDVVFTREGCRLLGERQQELYII